jgi:predicted signal transduction protein with EAL and GGDEF domain
MILQSTTSRYLWSKDLHPASNSGDVNSFALVALVMVVGIAAYMWWSGRLRSAAGLVTVAGIIALLVYVAFFAALPPA